LSATGVVQPALEVTVSPEVASRLVEVSPSLEPGGRLAEGEVIARIDPRDYRLAIRQEERRLRSAELEVQTEEGRGRVARREWEILGAGRSEEEAGLALRRPHREVVEASLDAARATLERARLSLSKTVIRAPWNAVVIDEEPGRQTAQLAVPVDG
jgi:multidrug resistance efflux pump